MGVDSFSDYSSQSDGEKEEEVQETVYDYQRWTTWDSAKNQPPEVDSGSEAAKVWTKRFEKFMRFIAYILCFIFVLCGAVLSKGVTLFIIAQLSTKDRKLAFCNDCDRNYISDCTKDYEIDRYRPTQAGVETTLDEVQLKQLDLLETEQVGWIWVIIFAFSSPELGTLFRSARSCFFKSASRPKFLHFLFVFVMETLHVVGLAILAFVALPALDSANAAIFSNGLALVPAIFLSVSRYGLKKEKFKTIKIIFDTLAIFAQLSAIFIIPILYWTGDKPVTTTEWALPAGLILTSFGWWECFLLEEKNQESSLKIIQMLSTIRHHMVDGKTTTRYFTYFIISIWKLAVFFAMAWGLNIYTGVLYDPFAIFSKFKQSFNGHEYNATEISDILFGASQSEALELKYVGVLLTRELTPVYVLIIQILSGLLTYIFAKFACKVQIQGFSMALPISFVVPVTVALLLSGCGLRARDACAFDPAIPNYLFYECPSIGDFFQYIWTEQVWLWGVWFISYVWICRHIWFPESPRLASTEQIFGTPMYCSLFVDQSVVMNRRRDGPVGDMSLEELEEEQRQDEQAAFYIQQNIGRSSGETNSAVYEEGGSHIRSGVHGSDRITKIYGCATMWHENKEEMVEMLKSIFRIDKDYSDRRLSQKYLGVVDKDFYEWETQIFFDDAFKPIDPDNPEKQYVNDYVKLLIRLMDEAGSFAHGKNIKVKPPKMIPTPYGGRLIWKLPGGTKIVCHLKDKSKIRHKKRWSQCMYMYYLLGFKLMSLPISDERKEVKAENTYLLALDGDIDFQSESITRLVDLMKKNQNLGAACGRIHPTGSGFMVWYQKFEYAIGHWLQKATEHVMGCVLCSPGCFSLFRGKALMDDNVMAKYTTKSEKPMDFVQYDQGEDRWLCTLLLQKGWRVEYSAASDAFTACPEAFGEFFNQRRRWMPSTIANIFDLLSDAKNVVKVNKDISAFYIFYQIMMMVGTILGPGTIFLMLVGAFSVAFGISNWDGFVYNLIPIIGFMLICFVADGKIQLFVAQVLSAIYGLIMMAVLVGILLQMTEDGPLSPSSLSIFLVGGSFILAACLHPQEFWCLPHGIIYYITIPAMYLLLVIYSIFNLNNVSWGTREVAAVKSKVELQGEILKAEEAAKEAKKHKKKEGILGFLMQQADKRSEKGGFEFSLANLFKCMCFTHDDPAGDANKKLDKIAVELDNIGKKLNRLDGSSGTGGNLFRRKSSLGQRSSRHLSFGGPGFLDAKRSNSTESGDQMDPVNLQTEDEKSSSEEEDANTEKKVWDDLVNPFWASDRDLNLCFVDYLPGAEQQFWISLIDKYLQPEPVKTAEVEKKQKEKEAGLLQLRNQMVFSFFMLNAIFVTAIFLLQQNKDLIFIRWPLDAKANVTFIRGSTTESHRINVAYDYLQLEPIGLVFVVFFAVVLGLQVVGMLFHRWGTICHIIATTKLAWCEKTIKNETAEGTVDKNARSFIKGVQDIDKTDKKNKNKNKKTDGRTSNRADVDGHRRLIRESTRQRKAEFTNLESDFKRKLEKLDFNALDKSDNPALRKIAARRGTIKALEERRNTFFQYERRRSTIRRMSSLKAPHMQEGINNLGYDRDSVLSVDEYSSVPSSRQSRVSQFEYVDPHQSSTTF